jgi:hypothetical protein
MVNIIFTRHFFLLLFFRCRTAGPL